MKITFLTLALALGALTLPGSLIAGGTGYGHRHHSHCAESKWSTPRLEQKLPYRHFEDRRRYNAAPCEGEIVYTKPYVVKTVVVRKSYEPHYTYSRGGHRHCHKVLTTVYKDIYSDGSCYVWYTKS